MTTTPRTSLNVRRIAAHFTLALAPLLAMHAAPPRASAWTVAVVTKTGTPLIDLSSTGLFTPGDIFILTPQGATPTLLDAQSRPLYDAVLVYSNAAFNNPLTLGNALADFVDAGGGVLIAAFSFTNLDSSMRLAGRLITDPGYSPFLPAAAPSPAPGGTDWPPLLPCHPVFDTLDAAPTYTHIATFGDPVLAADAIPLARTPAGANLIAANPAGTVIAINMHPRADLITDPRTIRLFANALVHVASGGLRDCNANSTEDACDIADADSLDLDADGVPDECQDLCYCGDFNADGRVDLLDFNTFAACLADQPVCAQRDHACADLDADGRVSLLDFVTFAALYENPLLALPPNCLPP